MQAEAGGRWRIARWVVAGLIALVSVAGAMVWSLSPELPASVRGVVRYADGTPAAGVRVMPPQVLTDEHGRFEIPQIRPQAWELRASAYAPEGRPIEYTGYKALDLDSGEAAECEIVLGPPRRRSWLIVTVRRPNGEPVAGIDVIGWNDAQVLCRAATGGEGRAWLDIPMRAGREIRVAASTAGSTLYPGDARGSATTGPADAIPKVELTLGLAPDASGRVAVELLDERGQPIEYERRFARWFPPHMSPMSPRSPHHDDGTRVVFGTAPIFDVISVPGYARELVHLPLPHDQLHYSVTMQLSAPRELHGRLRRGGRSLARARVIVARVLGPNGWTWHPGRTQLDGVIHLERLPPGRGVLYVYEHDTSIERLVRNEALARPFAEHPYPAAVRPIEIGEDTDAVDLGPIEIGGRARLTGLVTDADGGAVARTLVLVSDSTGRPVAESAFGAFDGSYELEIPAGGPLVVEFNHPMWVPKWIEIDATTTHLDTQLERGGSVRLRTVIYDEWRYGPPVKVRALADDRTWFTEPEWVPADDDELKDGAPRTFEIHGLPPGRVEVQFGEFQKTFDIVVDEVIDWDVPR